MTLNRLVPFLVLAVLTLAPGDAGAQKTATAPKAPTNDDCLACHGDASLTGAGGRPVAVAPEKYAASIHGQAGIECVSCHADLATATEFPHAEKLKPAACGSCHEQAVTHYDASVHARARRESAESVAATCKDCHGSHDVRSSKDPDSRTHYLNLPATCGHCHGSPEIISKGKIASGNVVRRFQDSIHGQALSRAGLVSAPNCTSCHGFHDIKDARDPSSPVYRTSVPATCGKCHEGIHRRYAIGIHGQELAKGNPVAPSCVKCHNAHDIKRVEAGSWRLQVLAECGSCHKEAIRTYRDTFHGQVTQLGLVRVATCADCHGAHDIFEQDDLRSSVSSRNVVATCGKCHEGANSSFAKYDPHADRDDRARSPLLFYTAKFMETLLAGVFLFFGVHTVLWFSRSISLRRARRAGRSEE